MVFELDQIATQMQAYHKNLNEMGNSLNVAQSESEIAELEEIAGDPDFWNDMEKAQGILQKTKQLKDKVEKFHALEEKLEDLLTLCEMGNEEDDESLVPEVKQMQEDFLKSYDHLRISTLLSGKYDANNAIVTLHPGAGGTEACDWVSILYRMYCHWVENQGFTYDLLDYQDGDEAGIKSVTFMVKGENAYGYLKGEKGVHRLVRISPFDSSGRRHTSFASCEVMPELDDSIEVDINPDDIKMDVFRSSGAGGQHINKTSSAVRLTHIPTGIVVACQNERSQLQNKNMCMKMLKAKLYEMKLKEQGEMLEGIRGEVKDIAWGSQIRSYVFHPYNMIKDHRTGAETANVQPVMNGNLEMFISAYLKWFNEGDTTEN
ncbi:MAG: peptide chain release factor 2 [Firmicutes bacterium]|nr:peptide chain release factor 2 [Bacillota bacterium]